MSKPDTIDRIRAGRAPRDDIVYIFLGLLSTTTALYFCVHRLVIWFWLSKKISGLFSWRLKMRDICRKSNANKVNAMSIQTVLLAVSSSVQYRTYRYRTRIRIPYYEGDYQYNYCSWGTTASLVY